MQILDGSNLAKIIRAELKKEVDKLAQKPKLVVMLIGDDPASAIYVNYKMKACDEVGIESQTIRLAANVTQEEVFVQLDQLNNDPSVTGILVQLPVPKHLDEFSITDRIHPTKDVDCLTPYNQGLLALGVELVAPCTPSGIIDLLKFHKVEIEGKNVVVVGRSNIVGKPMATMLLNQNATVSICHSRTKDLKSYTKNADILVVATGQPKLIEKEYVKEGAVVVDVGIHRSDDGLVGDVDFQKVKDVVSKISPVPGGVGPMTIASLLKNTLSLHFYQHPELADS